MQEIKISKSVKIGLGIAGFVGAIILIWISTAMVTGKFTMSKMTDSNG